MTITLPDPLNPLKIGTRGSPLALAQAHETRDRLAAAFDLPEAAFEIVVIKTTGDDRALIASDTPLKTLGGKGLFTREIEDQLLSGGIDLAVHSMKDMPVAQPAGLTLDCYLPREDTRDAFVALDGSPLADLRQGATVGTSSLRRRSQLLNRRPDLTVVEFRGNVQTRLTKLGDNLAEATFLAMAGLTRLGMLGDVPHTPIAPEDMLPAVAQGAIGIERRSHDARAIHMLEALHDTATGQRLGAERAFLAALDGSCQTPIAGLATLDGTTLRLRGEILRTDGSEALADDMTGAIEDGPEIGTEMARKLLAQAGPNFFDWR
ncbi:hydroxymethylbilane synthase [Maritimibacter sp. DP1N21-5]|uniref:hydroxymethylbilane synthase n=1 Tax=Maritimibacter sp. DP1N21-5 TaxID=2836867 RepID=UPI001C46BDAB|nr:hydroxymethylbilane synthase [Maritimibacter sp. DP1N21-5]MBV7408502.1 hydroxymethylbilane synthase [Maritimibacter sp. DP1N21-5]